MRLVENLNSFEFLSHLNSLAKKNPRRILLPEIEDTRILKAAIFCQKEGLAEIHLLGSEQACIKKFTEIGESDTYGIVFDDPTENSLNKYENLFLELKAKKNPTREQARKLIEQPLYQSILKLVANEVDGVVAGATFTTSEVLRASFSLLKKNDEIPVSSFFLMCFENGVKIFADCAVNIDPDAEQLAEICLATSENARKFGLLPIVSLVCYATGSSASGPDVLKIQKALEIIKEKDPDLLVDGPLQYDASLSPEIAVRKLPGSRVAGKANVLIFPNLSTGNSVYKAVQHAAGIKAAGPILQGLRLPINDLSRGASVEDIISTIVLTAVQSTA